MKFLTTLSFMVLQVTCTFAAIDDVGKQYLDTFFTQYQRDYTIVEATKSSDVYLLAKKPDQRAVSVIWLLEEVNSVKIELKKTPRGSKRFSRTLILKPEHTKMQQLKAFGRCEQPDVVLVHDVPEHLKKSFHDWIEPYLTWGDYLAVDIMPSEVEKFEKFHKNDARIIAMVPHENNDGGMLVMFKTEKKGIVSARWSTPKAKNKTIYSVTSTFSSKTLFKDVLHSTTPWEAGINLLTFIMLNGMHPSDSLIKKGVDSLKELKHNDLVIGNILIQGDALKPIDFNDGRRNIAVSTCVEALIKALNRGRKSFKTPDEFYGYYQQLLLR